MQVLETRIVTVLRLLACGRTRNASLRSPLGSADTARLIVAAAGSRGVILISRMRAPVSHGFSCRVAAAGPVDVGALRVAATASDCSPRAPRAER
jgi:hypothetical protein